ncbi:hypothetical protein BOTBODRAFT_98945 [Botryobasidium botryosum FD-172 SS1]|uniref:Uncharacterized protein n=1 Tax=Botryobasidium botryosum (strain FD-172 SS1) TaxID=930990 RepID=A0A067NBI7_BOTB1|nr:hypothetical protein BOTBODRAFT_98945 [Botryobasidium botryosum FD-172 SS1]
MQRAYLLLGGGDILAVVKALLDMKGPNAILPCRACNIQGIRPAAATRGEERPKTHYIPLRRPPAYPPPKKYNPSNLPLRTHAKFMQQARAVDRASTKTEWDLLAKRYGIKGTPILTQVSSLDFPTSFPPDMMHIVRNLIPLLIDHYTGDFKGLDRGNGSYELPAHVWEAIGLAAVEAGDTTPSAFGRRVPNIASARGQFTAESWFVWTTLFAPELLHKRFAKAEYYNHFSRLVKLINLCLKFSITKAELAEIRSGFIKWVEDYERYCRAILCLRLVDANAHRPKAPIQDIPVTAFARLEKVFTIELRPCQHLDAWLGSDSCSTLVLALVTPCKSRADPQTDIHHYKKYRTPEVIDAQCIQSVVGRIFSRGQWAIIDRNADLARAQFHVIGDDD